MAFFLFHSLLILFIVLGWIWRRTRLANLVINVFTLGSWFGLGYWYGWGYCPCTHWHWVVRQRLGHADMPRSYIKFLIDTPTGLDVSAYWVDVCTVGAFALVCCLSVGLTFHDWRRKVLNSPT